ncbi:hypothetical protein [Lactiplantibacillus plantarum]|uniref:hypothetical protein n=1 Tax=Lactiplantibacillus plantarum TaxID=1590 RepID=UPI001BABA78E|nr:hypothetical protein [Lactiplantibacillus plantarum]MBS0954999.1 hypothetical protein [Lactiplantibacillus plantarum]
MSNENVFSNIESLFGKDVLSGLEKKPVSTVSKEIKNSKKQVEKVKKEPKEKLEIVFGSAGVNAKDLDSKTFIGNARNQREYVLSEMFPEYFSDDGHALTKQEFNAKQDLVLVDTETEKPDSEEVHIAALTSEMVRCALAKDDSAYSSKALVNFVLDKKANMLMVIISAGTKGAVNVEDESHDALMKQLLPGGQIPINLLVGMIKVGKRKYYDNSKEVQIDIYYNRSENYYFLDMPEQEATLTSVKPFANVRLQLQYQYVGSWHCHHIFNPQASEVDDHSEVTAHLYGRSGNFSQNEKDFSLDDEISSPNTLFRTCVYGHFIELSVSEVFSK